MIIRKKKDAFELEQTHTTKALPVPAHAAKKQLSDVETIRTFEDIDISNIEFKERSERRRGDRRRGYRRIDERTLVSRAQEEAQNIRELASKEGYKNGLQEARADVAKLKEALAEFLNSKNDVYEHLSNDILEVALAVAKKIIKKEVLLDPEILKNVIGEVLDEVDIEEQKITLNVHPEDAAAARDFMPELLKANNLDARVVIIEDEEIQEGSCKVTTTNGIIDANFSTQLQIIQNAFRSLGPQG